MKSYILRTNGTKEERQLKSFDEVYAAIGCRTLDVVRLRHLGEPTMVMLVDDEGHIRSDKPPILNREATKLYWANCVPGTTHVIVGDVYVCPDTDWE